MLHATPALAAVGPLRRRALPGLAGMGRPDHVALTFDDGPDPASTPAVLEVLARLGWRATFFMLGEMAWRAPGVAAEVAAAGHEVALHGDAHRNLLRRTPSQVARDLRRGRDRVTAASGQQPTWYRPPYGVLTGPALLHAARLGLRPVLWTAWGRDWRAAATPASVSDDVLRGVVAGGTVLLHDADCTSAPGAWRSTVGALPLLAERLEAAGLRVGPLRDHHR
jgi:peptidoglycan/xylan/chitin deacetylase (PgdA/CDA1 family)